MITIKTDPQGFLNLIRDNNSLSCPYQPAIAMQGKLQGQIQMLRQPCSNNCPFFDYDKDNSRVTLQCKEVTLVVVEEKKTEFKLF